MRAAHMLAVTVNSGITSRCSSTSFKRERHPGERRSELFLSGGIVPDLSRAWRLVIPAPPTSCAVMPLRLVSQRVGASAAPSLARRRGGLA